MHPHPPRQGSTLPLIPAWECSTATLAPTPVYANGGERLLPCQSAWPLIRPSGYPQILFPDGGEIGPQRPGPPQTLRAWRASPDLLPDGGALMWARISLVSPVWLGLHWCQDASTFRARWPMFWRAATAPLHGPSSRSRWRDTISPGSQRYSWCKK